MATTIEPKTAEPSNVYEALLFVRKKVPYIQKTGEMSDGPKFKFASIDDYLFELKPEMDAAGIVITPIKSEIVERAIVLVGKYEAKWTRSVVKVQYRVVHAPTGSKADDPVEVLGEAQDMGDKSISKAYTMALKQCLRQIFQVETGIDPAEQTPSGGGVQSPAFSGGKHPDFDIAERTIRACRDNSRLAKLMERTNQIGFSELERSMIRNAYNFATAEIAKAKKNDKAQTEPTGRIQNPRHLPIGCRNKRQAAAST